MEKHFNFDSSIIDAMYLPNFSDTQWSESFLDQGMSLINLVQNNKPVITVKRHQETILPQLSSELVYQQYLREVERPAELKKHLKPYQYHLIKLADSQGIIHNLDGFNYFITHLPFHREIVDFLYEQIPMPQVPIYQYLMGSFISPVILSWIVTKCLRWSSYQIKVDKSINVTIDILHEPTTQPRQISATVGKICHIIKTLCQTYRCKLKPVHIIYVMTPFRKVVNYFTPNARINSFLIDNLSQEQSLHYNYNSFTNPLSTLHVNSGVTFTGQGTNYITIWRVEEFEKVLIHELIHFFELEKCPQIKPIWFNMSNNYPNYPKELLTELQTWYLYIIYRLASHKVKYTTEDLKFALDYERTYSLQNLRKILQHFHISDLSQVLVANPRYIINANSSILYYYIFKAILIYEIDDVIERMMLPGVPCQQCHKELESHLKYIVYSSDFRQYFNHLLKSPLNNRNTLTMMSRL